MMVKEEKAFFESLCQIGVKYALMSTMGFLPNAQLWYQISYITLHSIQFRTCLSTNTLYTNAKLLNQSYNDSFKCCKLALIAIVYIVILLLLL